MENNQSEFSSKILDILSKKCPMSLAISSKLINDAKDKSLKECLETEYQLSQKMVYRNDFDNGVNSVLVKKDHNALLENYSREQKVDIVIENYNEWKNSRKS